MKLVELNRKLLRELILKMALDKSLNKAFSKDTIEKLSLGCHTAQAIGQGYALISLNEDIELISSVLNKKGYGVSYTETEDNYKLNLKWE